MHICGVKLHIHASLYLYLTVVLVYASLAKSTHTVLIYGVLNVLSLTMHECGHCVAAYWLHVTVEQIRISAWGGTTILSATRDVGQDLLIATAGPLVQLIQVVFWYILGNLLGDSSQMHQVCWSTCVLNIFILVFNTMIPLPHLDGPQILIAFMKLEDWSDHQIENIFKTLQTCFVIVSSVLSGFLFALNDSVLAIGVLAFSLLIFFNRTSGIPNTLKKD